MDLCSGPGVPDPPREHPGHPGAGPPDGFWRRHLWEERIPEGKAAGFIQIVA